MVNGDGWVKEEAASDLISGGGGTGLQLVHALCLIINGEMKIMKTWIDKKEIENLKWWSIKTVTDYQRDGEINGYSDDDGDFDGT
ncbi:unnamed protein product [Sphenostylis stenocarpa]|uniref:Uncharacterized protein n=1 Tax=Sphenostylis stenocarpa TaxID=92480 RepID=A0AA86W1V7_9FABA|nr:unnamed protein product [Sphenostylis stenocarpa]